MIENFTREQIEIMIGELHEKGYLDNMTEKNLLFDRYGCYRRWNNEDKIPVFELGITEMYENTKKFVDYAVGNLTVRSGKRIRAKGVFPEKRNAWKKLITAIWDGIDSGLRQIANEKNVRNYWDQIIADKEHEEAEQKKKQEEWENDWALKYEEAYTEMMDSEEIEAEE